MEQMPENKNKNTLSSTGTELGIEPHLKGFFVVVLLIVFCFFALLIYRTIDLTFNPIKDFDKAAKIVLGVSGLIATFFLVYKSVILNRQVNEMIRQGERTERQLVNTAEQIELSRKQLQETQVNNLAKLLVDAASMIESKKQSDIKAGLAIFHKIGTTENSPFVTETINILRSFLRDYNSLIDFDKNPNSVGCQALDYLERICNKNNLTTDVDSVFVKTKGYLYECVYGINYFDTKINKDSYEKLSDDKKINNKYICCRFYHFDKFDKAIISNEIPYEILSGKKTQFYYCDIYAINIIKCLDRYFFFFYRSKFVNFRMIQEDWISEIDWKVENIISATEVDKIADFEICSCHDIFENEWNGSLSGEDLEWAEFIEKKGAKRLEKTDRAAGASHE